MSHDVDQSSIDERAIMRCLADCIEGGIPKGLGECILTSDELLWSSSKDLLNIPFNLWQAAVAIKIDDIENVSTYWYLPSNPVRIKAQTGVYAFTFRSRPTFHPLFFIRSRRESRSWCRAIEELRRDGGIPR